MFRRLHKRTVLFCTVLLLSQCNVAGQAPTTDTQSVALALYVDQKAGLNADGLVAYCLEHNLDLQAMRNEIDAAKALVKQARLRANPRVDLRYSQNVPGTDHTIDADAMLPLELGGRRSVRVAIAERQVDVREHEFANRQRLLAAEVRMKFGEALALILKLALTDELIESNQQSFNLVAARVTEGAAPPLEQNMVLVEVNRLKSMRENAQGRVQVAMLELRNLVGMSPEEPLRLRGNFDNLVDQLPTVSEASGQALRERPDLLAARSAEDVALAQIEQARAEGRLDASLLAGYEHMIFGFPVKGFDDVGRLQPVSGGFHYFKFGISLDVPVRNKNQGAIEAAVALSAAAKRRREFAELIVKHEVATAYAQYEGAGRAMEIFRVGVQQQARANLEVVRQTYELGSKTLLDYLGEQRRYIEFENDFVDSQLAAYSARVGILKASASRELIKR